MSKIKPSKSWQGLRPKRVSQAAIGKALGVSRATVSLILRGDKGAALKTQAKVIEMAKKMGYRPNALVRGIRSGKSRMIGVLVHPQGSFWTAVVHGIHDRLIEADHLPIFLWDSIRPEIKSEDYAIQQIHRLLDHWVDGVILWPRFTSLYADCLKEFESRQIPLVSIDHAMPQLSADTLASDEFMIAKLIVSHLAALNHRNFLVVSGPENLGWADHRSEALLSEVKPIPNTVVRLMRVPIDSDVTEQILESLRQDASISAVIACTDGLAQQVYRAAKRLNLSLPRDLSVVGVGNSSNAEVMVPPLTTIEQNGYEMGQKAAQINMERGSGLLTGQPRHYTLPVQLIQRGSTAIFQGRTS